MERSDLSEKEMPIKKKKPYQWLKWFEKGKFKLVHGKDYTCQDHGMSQQTRNAAKELGYKVSIKIGEGWISVVVVKKEKKGRRKIA
jgi:hypothetical protein